MLVEVSCIAACSLISLSPMPPRYAEGAQEMRRLRWELWMYPERWFFWLGLGGADRGIENSEALTPTHAPPGRGGRLTGVEGQQSHASRLPKEHFALTQGGPPPTHMDVRLGVPVLLIGTRSFCSRL